MSAPELARNRWPGLLVHFGIDRELLSGRHSPCPVCEGRDRFRFDDKEGRGTFICSHCGSGDGFKLLQLFKGWPFKQAAAEIEQIVGAIPASSPKLQQSAADKADACRRIWRESKAVTVGDPVHAYLLHRTGITEIPACIRFHPDLAYRHDDGRVTRHPAMLAKVTGPESNGVAIHRTYLTSNGEKANLPSVKKVVGMLPASSSVRLFQPGSTIGIAEGIETALSASVLFGIPVWSCISSGGMEKWTPPAGTERVVVCGDNDLSGTGQAAAWILAKRLIACGIAVRVEIPEVAGTDWNDVLRPAS
jgi:putative DNA primase/helicase